MFRLVRRCDGHDDGGSDESESESEGERVTECIIREFDTDKVIS